MANIRTYSDDQLRAAVAQATCWADVMESLGKGRRTNAIDVRKVAGRLGLDVSHLDQGGAPGRRNYSDDQLRAAVAQATCWADVMESLGKSRHSGTTNVRRITRRLGIDTSHLSLGRWATPVPASELPFALYPVGRMCSGLTLAARWFLERGHMVSIPLEPAPYDLVTESTGGLKRVQVKSTGQKGRSGRYEVRIARRRYDPDAVGNAAGRYRTEPYTEAEVDFFFILAGTDRYLIPLSAVRGLVSLVLDARYREFAV